MPVAYDPAGGSSKRHDGPEERVGHLDHDARAVAGVGLGAGRAAVVEAAHRGERLRRGSRCSCDPSCRRRSRHRSCRARSEGRRDPALRGRSGFGALVTCVVAVGHVHVVLCHVVLGLGGQHQLVSRLELATAGRHWPVGGPEIVAAGVARAQATAIGALPDGSPVPRPFVALTLQTYNLPGREAADDDRALRAGGGLHRTAVRRHAGCGEVRDRRTVGRARSEGDAAAGRARPAREPHWWGDAGRPATTSGADASEGRLAPREFRAETRNR